MSCTVRGAVRDAATNLKIAGANAVLISPPPGATINVYATGSYVATFATGTQVGYTIEGSAANYVTNQVSTGPMDNGQTLNGCDIRLTHV